MTIERFVIGALTAISITSFFYIPKAKFRLALVSLLTFQAITWASSLIFVQIGLIEYPVREFTRATKGNFVLLFIFVPTVYTWFILIYPNHASIVKKILHYFIFASIIAWFEYFICVYTDLQNFLKFALYINIIALYIRLFIYFKICHIYIRWFSKKANLLKGG